MAQSDVADCYRAYRNAGITPERPLKECDVLIHTYGGDPVAAYRLAQCIRDFAGQVVCLVPEYAYSAGTLLSFSSSQIRLGHCASLSPIDITMESEDRRVGPIDITMESEDRRVGPQEIELTSIDYYMEFTEESQRLIQKVLREVGITTNASVGSDLLCSLVDQVGTPH